MGEVIYLSRRARWRHARQSWRAQQPSLHQILLAYAGKTKRDYLAVSLARAGYEVTACRNGREALAHLSTGQFDLIVTGILMPYLDGLELVRALRHRPGPPIIAVADGKGRMDGIYLGHAALSGAAATHTFCETHRLIASADWILRGRNDVIKGAVW